jgi:NADH-quinone oxidoreductase subunit C
VSDETRDRPDAGEAGGEEREPALPAESPEGATPGEAPAEPEASGKPETPATPETPAKPETPAPAKAEAPAVADAPATPEASAEDEAAAKAKAAAAAKAKAEAAAKAKAAHEAAEAAKEVWERDPVAPEWEEADDDPVTRAVRERHPDSVESARSLAGDLTLEIRRDDIAEVCRTLKGDGFVLPVDICGAHYPDRESGRFEVVYHLYSFEANRRIRLKVRADEDEPVPSVTAVWVGANWPEREAWDMYGIRFSNHPDLTRILLWEGFNGFPLRKDFPVEGIDTGSAIYPEYYQDDAGPVAGTGTGWKPPEPPQPPEAPEPAEGDA